MSAFRPGKMWNGPWTMTSLLLLVLLTALAGPVLCQEEEETGEETVPDADADADADVDAAADDAVADTDDTADDAVDTAAEDETSVSAIPTIFDVTPTQDPSLIDPSLTESNATPDPNGVDTEGNGEGELSGDGDYGVRAGGGEDGTAAPDEGLSPTTIILVPVVLVVVIIGMVVGGIVINRRCNRKAGDADLGKTDPYLDENSTEKVPMPMFEEDVPSVLELEMEDLDGWINKEGGAGIESDHI